MTATTGTICEYLVYNAIERRLLTPCQHSPNTIECSVITENYLWLIYNTDQVLINAHPQHQTLSLALWRCFQPALA